MHKVPDLQEAQAAAAAVSDEIALIPGSPPCQVQYGGKSGPKGCHNHGELIISTVGVPQRVACPFHLHRMLLQMKQHPLYSEGRPFTVTFLEEG